MCQEVTWPVGGRVGTGPDRCVCVCVCVCVCAHACAYMCVCVYMCVFVVCGYMWRGEVNLSDHSSGTIYLDLLRQGLIGLGFS